MIYVKSLYLAHQRQSIENYERSRNKLRKYNIDYRPTNEAGRELRLFLFATMSRQMITWHSFVFICICLDWFSWVLTVQLFRCRGGILRRSLLFPIYEIVAQIVKSTVKKVNEKLNKDLKSEIKRVKSEKCIARLKN